MFNRCNSQLISLTKKNTQEEFLGKEKVYLSQSLKAHNSGLGGHLSLAVAERIQDEPEGRGRNKAQLHLNNQLTNENYLG